MVWNTGVKGLLATVRGMVFCILWHLALGMPVSLILHSNAPLTEHFIDQMT